MTKSFLCRAPKAQVPDPRDPEGGGVINFYPCCVEEVARLEKLATPLLRALATLFSGVGGQENAVKQTTKVITTPEGGSIQEEVKEALGIDPVLAESKVRMRDKAIQELVEAFGHEKNRILVMRLLVDSMRDEFPRPVKNMDESARALSAELDVEAFALLLGGLKQANEGVLGPLARRFLAATQPPQQPAEAAG